MKNRLVKDFSSFNKKEKVNEFVETSLDKIIYGKPLTGEERNMSGVSCRGHGIKDIAIWFGENSEYNTPIVIVGNIPNDPKGLDCFTIVTPNMDTIGGINENLITDEILEQIINFIQLNLKDIELYSNNDISTSEFFRRIKKVN